MRHLPLQAPNRPYVHTCPTCNTPAVHTLVHLYLPTPGTQCFAFLHAHHAQRPCLPPLQASYARGRGYHGVKLGSQEGGKGPGWDPNTGTTGWELGQGEVGRRRVRCACCAMCAALCTLRCALLHFTAAAAPLILQWLRREQRSSLAPCPPLMLCGAVSCLGPLPHAGAQIPVGAALRHPSQCIRHYPREHVSYWRFPAMKVVGKVYEKWVAGQRFPSSSVAELPTPFGAGVHTLDR